MRIFISRQEMEKACLVFVKAQQKRLKIDQNQTGYTKKMVSDARKEDPKLISGCIRAMMTEPKGAKR